MSNHSSMATFKREIPLLLASLLIMTACTEAPKETQISASPVITPAVTTPVKSNSKLKININKAPIAELDKLELPGTKPSLSERIQAARPYKTIDDLVTKKAISAEELGLIKSLVTTEDK